MTEELSHAHRRMLLALAIAGALVLVGAVAFVVVRAMTLPPSPVARAAEMAVSEPCPVRDDLIKRGLYIMPEVNAETGSVSPAVLKISDIERLVHEGVYELDSSGKLEFGTFYTLP